MDDFKVALFDLLQKNGGTYVLRDAEEFNQSGDFVGIVYCEATNGLVCMRIYYGSQIISDRADLEISRAQMSVLRKIGRLFKGFGVVPLGEWQYL